LSHFWSVTLSGGDEHAAHADGCAGGVNADAVSWYCGAG